MKFFGDIVIQSPDDKEDFRAFVHCTDSNGNEWELRANGNSAESAAKQAWEYYNRDEEQWDCIGYILSCGRCGGRLKNGECQDYGCRM